MNRKIIVTPNLKSLVETAAKRIASRISRSDGHVAICLTGGSTPKPIYELLAMEPYRSILCWDRIHWFWGDDRFVSIDDKLSNAGMAVRAFLAHVPVPSVNIHAMPTNSTDPEEAARSYEIELKSYYGRSEIDPGRPAAPRIAAPRTSEAHYPTKR